MSVKLYVIPGSHPSVAAELMLRHKGIEYKRVDLVTAMHKPSLKLLGFAGVTVPAMKIDGRKVQGTREISRALEELRPDPPLFPADPSARKAVEEAERWGDEELQPVPRRLAWWALVHASGADRTKAARLSLQGYRVGLPIGIASRTVGPIARIATHYNNASDDAVKADLAALDGLIDQVDALLAEGVIGGDELNAADFQIATSVRLLLAYDDLRERIEGRPLAAYARRVVPEYEAWFPKVFPAAWLTSAATPAAA